MPVQTITVVGAGIMGAGIAHVAALGGFKTILNDISVEILQQALLTIQKNLYTGVELGKVTEEAMKTTLGNIELDDHLERAARDADMIIEAVTEDIEVKLRLFAQLNQLCKKEAILASNTSSLSITEMAAITDRPDAFIGMHFFNPVHKMKLVEIIRGLETSEETIVTATAVAARMRKETVVIKESPGFITSRINALIGNEAFYMLEDDIASAEDIDKAVKLGLNHPMGPFEMADMVGLDTRLSVLSYLHRMLGEKYRPCPLLVKYVKAGRLGKKVGRGVYDYL